MKEIIDIAKIIEKNGGRLYLVGGAVRDKLFNLKSHDEDYCVVGLSSETFENLFPEAHSRGKAFLVYDLYGKEFAMARVEQKSGDKHSDFKIISNKDITIQQDLIRRDITINSIAEDVLTKEIIDPYNGINDFKNKTIKATSEKFIEDPLRAYRVARFASKFNFEVDKNTIELIKKLKSKLKYLSVERVFDEFRKALNTDYPQNFFDILKQADILDVHFEEIYKLIGALQPDLYHPEGDSYNHTMLALKMAASITKDEKIRFSALVHDLGKGLTPPNEYPHHIKHDVNGPEQVKKLGNRLKMPTSWIKCGTTAAREHMRGGIFYKMTPKKQIEFLERVDKSILGLKGLEIVVEADRNCRGTKKERVEFAELGKKIINNINGEYIMAKYKNMMPGLKLKAKIHEERISYLKNYDDKILGTEQKSEVDF